MKLPFRIPPYLYNKYLLASVGFVVWMLFFDRNDFFVQRERGNELLAHLKEQGILATGLYRLRFVTHLDVDAAGVDRAVGAIRQFFKA